MASRWTPADLAALRAGKIIGLRAGRRHRFIGVWMVLVERRLFVRSWSRKPDGWCHAFRADPRGAVQVGGRQVPVRAVQTRSERLKAAVDRAYREKYDTPYARRYVRDLSRGPSRDTTTELVPTSRGRRSSG